MKAHVALCLALVGCVADPPSLASSEAFIKSMPGDGEGCPEWGCGSNSPVIEATEFWELAEAFNVPNAQGFMITRFYKKFATSTLDSWPDVINGQLVAKRPGSNIISFDGYNVQGYVFDIVNVNTNAQYELVVAQVGKTDFWATPTTYFGAPPWTWTYNFTWRFPIAQQPPTGTTVNPGVPICGVTEENDGTADYTAVVFDDDRIDARTKRVLTERAGWFNIGCKKSALAKLHLTGNTKAAASRLGWVSTLAERTANLKMFTADYCGNGTVFTVASQPLVWSARHYNSTNDINTTYFRTEVESPWNQYGAICINTPRIEYRHTALGDATFPNGVDELMDLEAGWCTERNPRPPPCTGAASETQGALTISTNYRPRLNPIPSPL